MATDETKEKESALAKLDPATRAEIVEEVTWVLLERFRWGEHACNDPDGRREAARQLGVPFLLFQLILEREMGVDAREVRRHEIEEYVRWCDEHAPERRKEG